MCNTCEHVFYNVRHHWKSQPKSNIRRSPICSHKTLGRIMLRFTNCRFKAQHSILRNRTDNFPKKPKQYLSCQTFSPKEPQLSFNCKICTCKSFVFVLWLPSLQNFVRFPGKKVCVGDSQVLVLLPHLDFGWNFGLKVEHHLQNETLTAYIEDISGSEDSRQNAEKRWMAEKISAGQTDGRPELGQVSFPSSVGIFHSGMMESQCRSRPCRFRLSISSGNLNERFLAIARLCQDSHVQIGKVSYRQPNQIDFLRRSRVVLNRCSCQVKSFR